MLPRVAPTTGTTQPTPALAAGASVAAGSPVDAAVKPPLSAAALANLRAEVVLRLIETLLKHMPRTGEASPNRDLLETLLTVLKTLPGREGESGRKLADLIAKLPPEMRPAMEKLISAVLTAVPTRTLVEIVRNPNGPEAQKLAILLATNLTAEDRHATEGHTASAQKPPALTAQQLAVIGRHSLQQAAQMAQLLSGDARALQTMLKRIFDFDGGSKPSIANTRAAEITGTAVKLEKTGENKTGETSAKPVGAEKSAVAAKTDTAGTTETRGTVTTRTTLASPTETKESKTSGPTVNTGKAERVETHATTTARTELVDPDNQAGETRTTTTTRTGGVEPHHKAAETRTTVTASTQRVETDHEAGEKRTAATTRTGGAEPDHKAAEMPVFPRTSETRAAVTVPAPALADEQPPLEDVEIPTLRPAEAEAAETATPAVERREGIPAKVSLANATGQALARSVLQAVARDLPPALLTEAVVHLVENLSPDEATFLRTLLERPLDFVLPPDIDLRETQLPPVVDPEAEVAATTEQDANTASADIPEETARLRPDPAQTASVPARQAPALVEEIRPAQRLAENSMVLAQVVAQHDVALPAAVAREGIPLAFVPYLPAEEDLEWSETREAEEDEATDEDGAAGEQDGDEENAADTAGDGEEPETPDMVRRREKAAEMVGVIEPGLVFYQKLGDYWT